MLVAVVGGGFAGLAAALRLLEGGHEVALLERRALLGGRASAYRDAASGDLVFNGLPRLTRASLEALDLLRQAGVELDEHEAAPLPGVPAPLLWPRGGFAAAHERLAAQLEARGGRLLRRAVVTDVEVEHGCAWGVSYRQKPDDKAQIRRGERGGPARLEADRVLLAVPWAALRELLPPLPEARAIPAATVHLWFDRPVLGELLQPLTGGAVCALDAGRLHGRSGAPQHVAVFVTPTFALQPNSVLAGVAQGALGAPDPRRTLVVRDLAGAVEGGRAPAELPAGLALAGDWLEPATPAARAGWLDIESAVRSGRRAAAGW